MSIDDLIWLRNKLIEELSEKDADFFPATVEELHRLRWLEQAILSGLVIQAAKSETA